MTNPSNKWLKLSGRERFGRRVLRQPLLGTSLAETTKEAP